MPVDSSSPRDRSGCRFARSTRLAVLLTAVFLFALFMGAGPGILWINPSDEGVSPLVMGIPKVYAWAVFWTAVQAVVIVIASRTVWRTSP